MSGLYRMAIAIEQHLHAQGMQLLKACEEGALPVVRTITPRLYPPSSKVICGVPPPKFLLEIAVKHQHASVLRYLLANLPINPQNQTPWDPGSFYNRSSATTCRKDYVCDGLIYEAIKSGCPSVVQVLLDAGMNINHIPRYPTHQPISHAVINEDIKMVKFLLEKGADPDDRDMQTGLILLAYAAKNSSQDIMLALLEHGAQILSSGALIMAAKEGHISAARLLLKKGADVNEVIDLDYLNDEEEIEYREKNKEKWQEETDGVIRESTALHFAAKYGQIEMVKFLLKNGAQKYIPDWKSDLPVHKARQRGHREIVKLLESSTSSLSIQLTDYHRN